MTEKTIAEFFAGIGLVRLAFEEDGWRTLLSHDIDPKKLDMYEANFQDASDVYTLGDIRKLTESEIPRATLAWASFPCTDLSLAGERRGLTGSESGTFWPFTKLLEEMDGQRPPIVVLENVPGFVTSHGGDDLAAALTELNRIGYSVDAFILDAINFVPQSRARLFIVGVFDAPLTDDIPAALAERNSRLRWPRLTNFILHNPTIKWSLLDIPEPPRDQRRLCDVLEKLPPDSERWWSSERVFYLLQQMSDRHKLAVDHLALSKGEHYATVYRRVRNGKSMAEIRADGIAGCLRTPRGGSSRQILMVMGDNKIRARFLTPREYARLMGVPDTYKIPVNDNQAYFGFGDAVCVPAIEWIVRNAITPLIESRVLEVAGPKGERSS